MVFVTRMRGLFNRRRKHSSFALVLVGKTRLNSFHRLGPFSPIKFFSFATLDPRGHWHFLAMWRNLNCAKSASHRVDGVHSARIRSIRRLVDQKAPAGKSPDRRDKEPCLRIHGDRCYTVGTGAWLPDLECE